MLWLWHDYSIIFTMNPSRFIHYVAASSILLVLCKLVFFLFWCMHNQWFEQFRSAFLSTSYTLFKLKLAFFRVEKNNLFAIKYDIDQFWLEKWLFHFSISSVFPVSSLDEFPLSARNAHYSTLLSLRGWRSWCHFSRVHHEGHCQTQNIQ